MVEENGMVMMTRQDYVGMKHEYESKIENLNKRIELLQEALRTKLDDNELVDIQVARQDFLDIYDKELEYMFEVGNSEENFTEKNQKIYCHDITVHWNGIYCNCGDGATPSNYIIPAIKECDEELGGDEW